MVEIAENKLNSYDNHNLQEGHHSLNPRRSGKRLRVQLIKAVIRKILRLIPIEINDVSQVDLRRARECLFIVLQTDQIRL